MDSVLYGVLVVIITVVTYFVIIPRYYRSPLYPLRYFGERLPGISSIEEDVRSFLTRKGALVLLLTGLPLLVTYLVLGVSIWGAIFTGIFTGAYIYGIEQVSLRRRDEKSKVKAE